MTLPHITLTGNLTADPELRFTSTGAAVCKLRVACNDRRLNKQTNEWEDGDTTYLNVTAWRQLAENCADSLTKGMTVVVTGKLKSRSVDQPDGTKQTYFDVDADTVGPDLTRASARVTKTTKSNTQTAGQVANVEDPWNADPWATNQSSEVPF